MNKNKQILKRIKNVIFAKEIKAYLKKKRNIYSKF